MEVDINWLGIGAATLASMVVGAVWYARPVFGNRWMKLVKLDEKKMREQSPKALLIALLGSALTAYVLAHVTYLSYIYLGGSYFNAAVTSAIWIWAGFVAVRFMIHDAFEMRDVKLTFMNIGNELVTFLAMGLAIGLVGL